MHIIDLRPDDEPTIRQVAVILMEGFREHPSEPWSDLESALAEVRESFEAGRISRVAIEDDGQEDGAALGWIGGIPEYDGRVWELHPLVVAPASQRRGIGRALVADLEARAQERGGLTLWAGIDDEDGSTSLGGVNLYDDLPARLESFQSLGTLPHTFYQRLGFRMIGVMPDANAIGRPDIFLAKSIGTVPADER